MISTVIKLENEKIDAHSDSILSVQFSPDGTKIVSGSDDQTIKVWDASSLALVTERTNAHSNMVTSVQFSPDGTKIVSGSRDKTIKVWDSATLDLKTEKANAHSDWIKSVAFSPDGTKIVSGSEDKVWDDQGAWTKSETIKVWDAASLELKTEKQNAHSDWIKYVAFSPDGKTIVSGSDDKTIKVWDAESLNEVSKVENADLYGIDSVQFAPDGKTIVSGGSGTIKVWDATPSEWEKGEPDEDGDILWTNTKTEEERWQYAGDAEPLYGALSEDSNPRRSKSGV